MRLRKNTAVSVIVPVHNAHTVVLDCLQSLDKQRYPVAQIIIVDDGSTDGSKDIIVAYSKRMRHPVRVVSHTTSKGLGASYNAGLETVRTPLTVILMSDCVLQDKASLHKLVEPFLEDDRVVQSVSFIRTSKKTWEQFSFWQKCFFSRRVDLVMHGWNLSFACFRTKQLREVGGFSQRFFRAGEDGNIRESLRTLGNAVEVDTIVEHVHSLNQHFSLFDWMYKECQHAEGIGAGFTFRDLQDLRNTTRVFVRPVALLCLFIPPFEVLAVIFITYYLLWNTGRVYLHEWRDIRLSILPMINFVVLILYSVFLIRGLVTRKQTV